jgi:phosphonoacetaldehyde hydrolase
MSFACLERLGLPRSSVAVKVDDTQSGIEEGRNAGLFTVAVAVSGNEVGLSLQEWMVLTPAERERVRASAYARLQPSKPDFIIDTVADLDGVLDAIEG